MRVELYDVTNSDDYIGPGAPMKVSRIYRFVYNFSYRMVRDAYKRNEEMDLLIVKQDNTVTMLSSIPDMGILLLGSAGNSVWIKER